MYCGQNHDTFGLVESYHNQKLAITEWIFHSLVNHLSWRLRKQIFNAGETFVVGMYFGISIDSETNRTLIHI